MDIDALYAEAMADIDAGRHDEAQRLLAQVLVANPRHEQAWLALGLVVPEMDRAIECLNRVLVLNPHNAEAKKYLALAQDMKHRDQALEAGALGQSDAAEETSWDETTTDESDESAGGGLPNLGKLLLESGALTLPELQAALELQRKLNAKGKPQRLGELLVDRRIITQDQLNEAVRDQHARFNNLFWD
jgi:tetratricopeptide (TPR) repeat protein